MLTPNRDHLHGRGTTQPRRRNDSASDVIQPPSSATPVLAQWAPESGRHVDSDGDLHTGLVWALSITTADLATLLLNVHLPATEPHIQPQVLKRPISH